MTLAKLLFEFVMSGGICGFDDIANVLLV